MLQPKCSEIYVSKSRTAEGMSHIVKWQKESEEKNNATSHSIIFLSIYKIWRRKIKKTLQYSSSPIIFQSFKKNWQKTESINIFTCFAKEIWEKITLIENFENTHFAKQRNCLFSYEVIFVNFENEAKIDTYVQIQNCVQFNQLFSKTAYFPDFVLKSF